MKVTFKVQHGILSGLKYVQVVKRGPLRQKDQEMIVWNLINMTDDVLTCSFRVLTVQTPKRSPSTRRPSKPRRPHQACSSAESTTLPPASWMTTTLHIWHSTGPSRSRRNGKIHHFAEHICCKIWRSENQATIGGFLEETYSPSPSVKSISIPYRHFREYDLQGFDDDVCHDDTSLVYLSEGNWILSLMVGISKIFLHMTYKILLHLTSTELLFHLWPVTIFLQPPETAFLTCLRTAKTLLHQLPPKT